MSNDPNRPAAPEIKIHFGKPRTTPPASDSKPPAEVNVTMHPGAPIVPTVPLRRFGMTLPRNGLLRFVMVVFAAGIVTRLFSLAASPANLSEHAGTFVVNQFAPYYFGAIWSGVGLVCLVACAAAVLFLLALLVERFQSRKLARTSLGVLLFASLFTLWIEPRLSWEGAVAGAFMKFVGLAVVDLIVTGIWIVLSVNLLRQIDRELPGEATPFLSPNTDLKMTIGSNPQGSASASDTPETR